jgi:uncharacterized linocin/CFP29 family protein
LVELRVPFTLQRSAVDAVERGAKDADWTALKAAARKLAFAEDRAVFDGYSAGGIDGIRPSASTRAQKLDGNVMSYPGTVAKAVASLRLAGVGGPYSLVLGEKPFSALSGGTEDGYPVLQHVQRVVDGEIIWAPAIAGGVVLSTRGGDFELALGQDVSIGYAGHSATHVGLYLQESFTFRTLTAEVAVTLLPLGGTELTLADW